MGAYVPELLLEAMDASLPDGWGGAMRFKLTYLGSFPPVGGNGGGQNRVLEKWEVRRQVHHQLADLYAKHPALAQPPKLFTWTVASDKPFQEAVKEPKKIGAYEFIPLARKSLGLACELDITYLRAGAQMSLIMADGDLDNHMNTLFDGLKMPSADVLDRGGEIPRPMYCLLDDDALITSLTVRTERLLAPPPSPDFYAHLLIDVNIKVLEPSGSNVGFIGE